LRQVSLEIPGRVALVTGAGSGIGRAVSVGLAAAGVTVAVAAHRLADARESVEMIAATGGAAVPFAGDLADEEVVRKTVAETTAQLGAIDILINSVGIYPRSTVAEMTTDEWDMVLSANLRSVFLAARAVVPGMMNRQQGRIVSITSSLGQTGAERGAHYAASKAGIVAFTRSLAREVRNSGITVNCIAPGLTDTRMMRGANSPEYIEAVVRNMPGGRLGQPDDPVGLALFLVSDAGRHITGQEIALRS
jgi:3-oxoacyl-[acyl-carrier protein] reductase